MIIIGLTALLAWVLRVPLEGNWFLAVLVPLEIVYAVICWFDAALYLGRMADGERRNVGWGTKIFAPEFVLLCLPMLIKGEGPELVRVVWEKWNGWLAGLNHTTYSRAACGTVAVLVGFCLTVAAFAVEKEITLVQVPTGFMFSLVLVVALSIVTTIQGEELGKWYSRWLLAVGFFILWEFQTGKMDATLVPFSATFFALFLGRFMADVGWKREDPGNEIASAAHSQ